MKESAKKVPVNQIPEVERYTEAEDKLQQFIEQNQKLMDDLSILVEERNQALQEADEAVRAACAQYGCGINCGPFRFKHFAQRVDFEAMYDALGEEGFTALGGAIKTVPKYTGEKSLVIRAIYNGQVPKEQADMFYKATQNYQKIQMVVLP